MKCFLNKCGCRRAPDPPGRSVSRGGRRSKNVRRAPRRRVGNVERGKAAGKLEESGQEKGVRRVLATNSLQ